MVSIKLKSKKTLRKKCDKLWSEIVRSKKYCEKCGILANNPHHIIGRVNYVLRWDLKNGCLLCQNCHWLQKYSAHQDPLGFMEWLKLSRPEDYEYLKQRKNQISQPNYDEILKYLKFHEALTSSGSLEKLIRKSINGEL